MDDYPTIDPRAVVPLIPHLTGVETYIEPCAGNGDLVRLLEPYGLVCTLQNDITYGFDALDLPDDEFAGADAIITNPPWSRPILHALIVRFQTLAPTWLLFDADWAHTKQSAPFLDQCSHIVAVGRLRWIKGTNQTGKDNCSWYRFDHRHSGGPRFYGHQRVKEAA